MKPKNEYIAIFLATFLGFIFAVGLFIVQENIKEAREKKLLIKNVIYETEYNLLVLDKFDQDFEMTIRKIMNGNKNVILPITYSDVRFTFLNKLYQNGDLISYLTLNEFIAVHKVTARYSPAWGDIIHGYVKKWNNNNESKKDILIVMEFEKTNIGKSEKVFQDLIIKLNNVI